MQIKVVGFQLPAPADLKTGKTYLGRGTDALDIIQKHKSLHTSTNSSCGMGLDSGGVFKIVLLLFGCPHNKPTEKFPEWSDSHCPSCLILNTSCLMTSSTALNLDQETLSLDRYLAVVHATNSQAPRKLLVERVIYVGVWLPAALLTVPDLVFAKTQESSSRMMCMHIYPQQNSFIWMAAFRFQHIFVGFIIPGLIILTCYCIIIVKLSRGSTGQQKRKALKTTVILILCFFSCWLPYCAGIFVDTLMMLNVVPHSCALEQSLQTWISITEALAYFHCCLNPILYAFLGVKFKKSARNALTNGRGSSLKILPKKKGGLSSVSTESESSSFHSS
ncbi:hypothetical protein AAFF_G00073290 [Aldrovandia affinis]|uniref:G-protein coupled receptors family 1 profile domain-containing protein n=1 Tax=Aldrovandia affinis TaxID=143900 RepID=A0AAD7WDK1_9TELE|nr:hypothetical protein AAFF_G00073290 [Aldrovandia affinis]